MAVIILTQVARPALISCAVRVTVAGSIARGQDKSLGVCPSFEVMARGPAKRSVDFPVAESAMSGDNEEQADW